MLNTKTNIALLLVASLWTGCDFLAESSISSSALAQSSSQQSSSASLSSSAQDLGTRVVIQQDDPKYAYTQHLLDSLVGLARSGTASDTARDTLVVSTQNIDLGLYCSQGRSLYSKPIFGGTSKSSTTRWTDSIGNIVFSRTNVTGGVYNTDVQACTFPSDTLKAGFNDLGFAKYLSITVQGKDYLFPFKAPVAVAL
jgi:hypothetical protein